MATLAPPPVGYVRVSTTDPPMRVLARLWSDPVAPEAGYGGWVEVTRPRKSPLTTWQASPGLRLQLPILLDAWAAQTSVEKQIADVELMGRPVASNGSPPIVKVQARGGHVPYQSKKWVVDTLAFGDALMNTAGDRTRQQITLHLLEYVEDVYLAEQSAANRERAKAASAQSSPGASKKRAPSKGGSAGKTGSKSVAQFASGPLLPTYPFGAGESLVRVAARELGDATRWPELADLNNLRDPRAVPFGQVIRLP
jgi:nucleoid-associated protein YgaU